MQTGIRQIGKRLVGYRNIDEVEISIRDYQRGYVLKLFLCIIDVLYFAYCLVYLYCKKFRNYSINS